MNLNEFGLGETLFEVGKDRVEPFDMTDLKQEILLAGKLNQSLGIIPSMQPTHATSDKNMAETRVGPDRIKGAYAWRTFLHQGSRIACGSDFPVESPNPFFGIHAAVTRQDASGQPIAGWYPTQAMSLKETSSITKNRYIAQGQTYSPEVVKSR